MAILTHGSDLTLAPTVGPLVHRHGGTLQRALEVLKQADFEAVQLDVTLSGLRPRELTHRARQDLLALLGRRHVRLSGLDQFLPSSHFVQSQHVDRAMTATLAAIELAADLGRVPLSIALPVGDMSHDALAALVECADGHGVTLAVHAEDQLEALRHWLAEVDLPALGAAVDPAALLSHSLDPVHTVRQLGKHLAAARLSDVNSRDGLRCVIGAGSLDVMEYRLTVDLATGRWGPVILDLRGLENPLEAAQAGKHAWVRAAFTI